MVHDLAQAEASLAAARAIGLPVLLVSAPAMATLAGVGFARALEQRLGVPLAVDCGGDAGVVMEALRAGLRELLFSGEERLRAPLTAMVEAAGGRLRATLDVPLLALEPGEDPTRRLALGSPAGLV